MRLFSWLAIKNIMEGGSGGGGGGGGEILHYEILKSKPESKTKLEFQVSGKPEAFALFVTNGYNSYNVYNYFYISGFYIDKSTKGNAAKVWNGSSKVTYSLLDASWEYSNNVLTINFDSSGELYETIEYGLINIYSDKEELDPCSYEIVKGYRTDGQNISFNVSGQPKAYAMFISDGYETSADYNFYFVSGFFDGDVIKGTRIKTFQSVDKRLAVYVVDATKSFSNGVLTITYDSYGALFDNKEYFLMNIY